MKFPISFVSLGLALITVAAHAGPAYPKFLGPVDDQDLSGGFHRLPPQAIPLQLAPDSMQVIDDPSGLSVQVFREDHGVVTPVIGLNFALAGQANGRHAVTNRRGLARFSQIPGHIPGHIQSCGGKPVTLVAPLITDRFSITQGRKPYEIVFQAPCTGLVKLLFKQDTSGGQALGIWQVAARARMKLEAEVGLGFWNRRLTFVWPDSADYYTGLEVHISRGDHWDVVGHELGHGIYDLGDLGQFGGGAHKIDECYSDALALSEGWASFFSAWISVDLRDPDAKFEYMVPRRAPLRFENVPEDVCKGQKNEWRVTGFFWDLIDLHDDGENSEAPFLATWKALFQSHARSAADTLPLLQQRGGFDPKLLQLVWDLNFRAPARLY